MSGPEFKIGEVVTYQWGGFCMGGVVIDVYQESGEYRYLLMEEPEGKPLKQHNQVDAHPAYIMESRHFKNRRPSTVYQYDKETHKLRVDR